MKTVQEVLVTNSLNWQKAVHLVTKESRIISVTEDKISIYINTKIMNLASQGILKQLVSKRDWVVCMSIIDAGEMIG